MGSEFLGEREPQSSEGLLVIKEPWGTLVSTRQRYGCPQLWIHTNPSAPTVAHLAGGSPAPGSEYR